MVLYKYHNVCFKKTWTTWRSDTLLFLKQTLAIVATPVGTNMLWHFHCMFNCRKISMSTAVRVAYENAGEIRMPLQNQMSCHCVEFP